MDDNIKYAEESILGSIEEARQHAEELYVDELRGKVDKILSDTKEKISKTFNNFYRKWTPPHNENGANYDFRT